MPAQTNQVNALQARLTQTAHLTPFLRTACLIVDNSALNPLLSCKHSQTLFLRNLQSKLKHELRTVQQGDGANKTLNLKAYIKMIGILDVLV